MSLKLYESFNQIKNTKEELKIISYKDSIENDPEEK